MKTVRVFFLPALILLAAVGPAAAGFDLKKGPPAVVRFTNKKKVALVDVTLNCGDNPPSLAFYWVDNDRAVYDFPAKNGRRKIPAGMVKQLSFKPALSLEGNKFPKLPVYSVVVKLRSGEKIKTLMQCGNIWGNYSGPAPKIGTIQHQNGKPYWGVIYDYTKTPSTLRLKDITYPALPGDIDPDAEKK